MFKKITNSIKPKVTKGVYDSQPFNIISNSEILAEEDFSALESLTEELKETFVKAQMFRTRTEMEVSVLNNLKFPTHSSKYWQATREQNVMFQELVMLSYEYRKNLVKIKIVKKEIEKEEDELKKELLLIELDRKIFISKNQEKTAKARIGELREWSDIKEREAKSMDEKELENVDTHQKKSYVRRWIKQSISMGGSGSPAERQNLHGQLCSGIMACIADNTIDDVLSDFSQEIQDKIKREYNIK